MCLVGLLLYGLRNTLKYGAKLRKSVGEPNYEGRHEHEQGTRFHFNGWN